MENLILVKLGGSVITDKKKDFTVREENILRLGRELKSVLKSGKCKIIIGHGAGSFAHVPAYKYKTKEGLIKKDSLYGMGVTEDAARKLNSIVIEKFLSLGLPVFSFSPASFLISDAKVCSKSYLDPIKKALQIGIIPVVYGDVILDKKTGCTIFSTEKILSILAKELQKNYKIRIIYVTDVDGVYDKDPMRYKNAIKFDTLTYEHAIAKRLGVMDRTAFALAANNNLPLVVFKFKKDALVDAAQGKKIGTLVKDKV